MQLGFFNSYPIAPNQSYRPPVAHSPYGPRPAGPQGGMNMLFNLMTSLAQLAQGWGSFGGFNPYGQQFPPVQHQPQPYHPAPNPGAYSLPTGGGGGVYGGGSGGGTVGGGYGGTTVGGGNISPPRPSDPQEFSSYIQAQIAGGALEGKTGVAQRDAIPGSRFGQVQDSTMWQASLARNYAYQFAAQAVGANPLSPQGLNQGMQAFEQMKPEAQLFMQVASVFKGDLLGGPGFYDNPGLKNLLLQKGLGQFVNDPQVGQTDVQTIGAITAAINSGQLSLNDVIQSGTISDMNRYQQVIGYVSQGGFAADLRNYDTVPI